MRKKIALILLSFVFLTNTSCSTSTESEIKADWQKPSSDAYAATVNSIVATDALGRSFGEADVYESDKDVGVFYSVWHSDHVGDNGILDITKLQKEDPDSLWDISVNTNLAHYWGEPLYGYYASDDPWVIERHLELFMSGIDYLALDLTNISYYERNCRALFDKISELQSKGWNVPKVMGLFSGCPYRGQVNIDKLNGFYNTFYKDSAYDGVWYRKGAKNKPLIAIDMANEFKELSFDIQNYFCFRNLMWPWSEFGTEQYRDMAWMDWCKDQVIFDVENLGMMSVSVAQHSDNVDPRMSNSVDPALKPIKYNYNRGRGWTYYEDEYTADFANYCNVYGTNDPELAYQGTNLQHCWNNAHKNRNLLSEVLVTGWNEWIAFKNDYGDGRAAFVDLCDMEFSRDLEMMKDGYGDNFYLQNMLNTRKFKNTAEAVYRGTKTTPNSLSGFWDGARTYLDFVGDALERDWYDATRKEANRLKNNTNRNDIEKVEVTDDGKYLYIRITTNEDIVVDADKTNNLNVLLSIHGANGAKWEGYDYIINRVPTAVGGESATIEKVALNNKFEWSKAADCRCYLNGKTFAVKIALSDLGISEGKDFTLDFKVADGISEQGNIINYYVDGDCAPIGRLNYRYNSAKEEI
ncbi:MAG: hypothetical protein J6N93_06710 [Clostridia bacterium]|nr:hypothetical protein [Clostridia bacterium]